MSTPHPKSILDAIKQYLISKGWSIDPDAKENESGELEEFFAPGIDYGFAWLDAIEAEMESETENATKG